jgi:2-polyprenyl-3-methyl-5-hydroxy-6-metoxy-1,4-benzoquinol methylase
MSGVSETRWQLAQNAERRFWKEAIGQPEELLHLVEEKYAFIAKIRKACPDALRPPKRPGRVLEVGIGPLGVGVATLLEDECTWNVTGVDPLPRMDELAVPEVVVNFYNALRRRPINYVQLAAEQFSAARNSFDLAICYNVLDHVQDPALILKNIFEMLVRGGYFALYVTTISVYSKCRRTVLRKFDTPHPYKFDIWQVFRFLKDSGFEIVWYEKKSRETIRRLFGRGPRYLVVVARKPTQ